MARKTVTVKSVIGFINDQLRHQNSTIEGRQALALLAEKILHDSDNYVGFQYLSEDQLPANVLPGIRFDKSFNPSFENTDSTRIRFLGDF